MEMLRFDSRLNWHINNFIISLREFQSPERRMRQRKRASSFFQSAFSALRRRSAALTKTATAKSQRGAHTALVRRAERERFRRVLRFI
jgi:hypothetical protein